MGRGERHPTRKLSAHSIRREKEGNSPKSRYSSPSCKLQTGKQNLTRFLAFKHAHFTAVAHYRRSLDDLGANRYGDELGRLRICERALADVLKPGGGGGGGGGKRGVPEAVVRDLKVRAGEKLVSLL